MICFDTQKKVGDGSYRILECITSKYIGEMKWLLMASPEKCPCKQKRCTKTLSQICSRIHMCKGGGGGWGWKWVAQKQRARLVQWLACWTRNWENWVYITLLLCSSLGDLGCHFLSARLCLVSNHLRGSLPPHATEFPEILAPHTQQWGLKQDF